jgi:hypothetical protein
MPNGWRIESDEHVPIALKKQYIDGVVAFNHLVRGGNLVTILGNILNKYSTTAFSLCRRRTLTRYNFTKLKLNELRSSFALLDSSQKKMLMLKKVLVDLKQGDNIKYIGNVKKNYLLIDNQISASFNSIWE